MQREDVESIVELNEEEKLQENQEKDDEKRVCYSSRSSYYNAFQE